MTEVTILAVTPKNENVFLECMPRALAKKEIALGAFWGDAPCGCMILASEKEKNLLNWLYVLPEYRNLGVGSALLGTLDMLKKDVEADIVLPQDEGLYRCLLYHGFMERTEELMLYETASENLTELQVVPRKIDGQAMAKIHSFEEMTKSEMQTFADGFSRRFPEWLDPAAYGGIFAINRKLSFFHGMIGQEDAFLFTTLPQPDVVMISGLYAAKKAKLSLVPMLQKAVDAIVDVCPDRTLVVAAASEEAERLIKRLTKDFSEAVRIRRQILLHRRHRIYTRGGNYRG